LDEISRILTKGMSTRIMWQSNLSCGHHVNKTNSVLVEKGKLDGFES
jgi:hypothetical protein